MILIKGEIRNTAGSNMGVEDGDSIIRRKKEEGRRKKEEGRRKKENAIKIQETAVPCPYN
ncbi:hypothetical protein [Tychonema sp. BBK16]|uniref:hypothetical protein n=1 Tax=Tychonema sp. BBK16 TaxID=2699888 RepID=UPI0038D31792